MRILFDQGTPAPLRDFLPGHTVATAYEMGWPTLENGVLLGEADQAGFDLFITTDQNLRQQLNLAFASSGNFPERAFSSSPRDGGVGRGPRDIVIWRPSSPRPSPPSDGGEGACLVAVVPR